MKTLGIGCPLAENYKKMFQTLKYRAPFPPKGLSPTLTIIIVLLELNRKVNFHRIS